MVGSSHTVTGINIINGTSVKFNFDGINLPDSNSNEPASHGWITYTIDQVPGLLVGTQIRNTAAIYFDYNAPVITNTTLNTIGRTKRSC